MKTEETLSSVWDQHIASEFAAKSAEQALATMTAEPYVNEVPLMIGARGREELHDFYANHFLNQIPPDMEMVPVSRTIGQGRVVDELIARFTHSIRMDWLLPGIAPTGKRVEIPFVVIVQFEGDKLAHEHLYWDQASVLVQVGLLDRTLPVRGGEIAAQVLNPTQPMNELIRGNDHVKQEPTHVIGVHHVGLSARDPAALAAFYHDVLGLQVVGGSTADTSAFGASAFLSSRPAEEHHDLVLVANPAFQHTAFKVGSLAHLRAVYQRVLGRGVQVKMAFNHGVSIAFYFEDPEGHLIEVYWPTGVAWPQPYGDPIDLTLSEEALQRKVRELVAG